MKEWAEFYERLFNFREVRYFDIEGQLTGLKSKAMTSPCGKIRIPINESSDDKSQIVEYLDEYRGEGIQHVALATGDIYATVRAMKQNGVAFQDTIDTYYDLIDTRLPNHGEPLAELKLLRILIDGATHLGAPNELLLQIFTQTVIGPIFFEIIQRKGDEGFGEGNFRALFESIELDQIRRGVLKPDESKAPAVDPNGSCTRHLRRQHSSTARRLFGGARRLHVRPALGALHAGRTCDVCALVRAPGQAGARSGVRGIHRCPRRAGCGRPHSSLRIDQ